MLKLSCTLAPIVAHRLESEQPQAVAASVFVEGGWLNPELGDSLEHGADLALTFPDVCLAGADNTLQRTSSRHAHLADLLIHIFKLEHIPDSIPVKRWKHVILNPLG